LLARIVRRRRDLIKFARVVEIIKGKLLKLQKLELKNSIAKDKLPKKLDFQ